jgi:hypothetical protein
MPNQLRAAGNFIQDTPIQLDVMLTHSFTIPGKLKLPLQMHCIISHLQTCKPTLEEIKRYQSGLLQAVDLTTPPFFRSQTRQKYHNWNTVDAKPSFTG